MNTAELCELRNRARNKEGQKQDYENENAAANYAKLKDAAGAAVNSTKKALSKVADEAKQALDGIENGYQEQKASRNPGFFDLIKQPIEKAMDTPVKPKEDLPDITEEMQLERGFMLPTVTTSPKESRSQQAQLGSGFQALTADGILEGEPNANKKRQYAITKDMALVAYDSAYRLGREIKTSERQLGKSYNDLRSKEREIKQLESRLQLLKNAYDQDSTQANARLWEETYAYYVTLHQGYLQMYDSYTAAYGEYADMLSQYESANKTYNDYVSMFYRKDGSVDYEILADAADRKLEEYMRSPERAALAAQTNRSQQENGNTTATSYLRGGAADAGYTPSLGVSYAEWSGGVTAPADQKKKELESAAAYYRQQADLQHDQDLLDLRLKEIESWTPEEQWALQEYIMRDNEVFTKDQERAVEILRSKMSQEEIDKYARALERKVNADVTQAVRGWAKESSDGFWGGAAHSLGSVGAKLVGAITSPIGAAADMLRGPGEYRTLDSNNLAHLPNTYASEVVGNVAENIKGSWAGGIGSTLYQAGMSAADNLTRLAVAGPTGSLALAGLGSFGQTVQEASAQGATPTEAMIRGLGAGALEVLTEKVSLDRLLGDMSNAPGSKMEILKRALIAAGVEVSEEEMNFIGNIALETLVMKGRDSYTLRIGELIAGGMSYQEAASQANHELLEESVETAVQSALSGGMMSGVSNTKAYIQDTPNRRGRKQMEATDGATDPAEVAAPEGASAEAQGAQMPPAETGATVYEPPEAGWLVSVESGVQVEQGKMDAAKRLAGITGRKIVFYANENVDENGYYDPADGKIHLNAMSGQIARVTFAHELTHSVEQAGAYAQLRDAAFAWMENKGVDIDSQRRELQSRYAKNGVQMKTRDDVDREMVARFVERELLTNEQSIRDVVQYDRSLGQKILNWIDSLLAKLQNRRAQERVLLENARRYYAQALKQTPTRYGAEATPGVDAVQYGRNAVEPVRTGDPETDAELEELADMRNRGEMDDRTYRWNVQQVLNEYQRRKAAEAREPQALRLGEQFEDPEEFDNDGFDDYYDTLEQDEEESGLARSYSFGGESAVTADLEALERAKRLERQGVAAETIRRQTGWFKGRDGKWRWEIDDSGMQYHAAGDALFSEMHPEYARHQELMRKWLYGELTAQEEAEFRGLDEIWGRERQRLKERADRGNAQLQNMIRHDALFEAYPWLRGTKVRFAELPDGTRGQYNSDRNEIVLNNSLRRAPESTLTHEIQHAIQNAEGFASGASTEYWDGQMVAKPEYAEEVRKAEVDLDQVETRFHQEWSDDINLDLAKRYVELDNQVWSEGSEGLEELALQELTAQMEQIEQAAEESGWDDLLNDYYYAAGELQMAKYRAKLNRRTSRDLYRNTAGEIEARDAAARRTMTPEERKNTPPDLGGGETVFAESGAISRDFAGWTADGNEVYKTSPGTLSLSISDRIKKFKQDFTNNFRGRTARITRNGHVYYARFSDDSSVFGKLTYEGNAKSSQSSGSGYKAKIRMLADGSVFDLVEDADYRDTAAETGGKNASHKNAKFWDYLVKTIIVDGKAYDVLISVRLDDASGNWNEKEHYVYSIRFRDNKTVATSVASPASSKVLHQGDVATKKMVTDAGPNVKQFSIGGTEEDGGLSLPSVEENGEAQEIDAQRKALPAKAREHLERTERGLVKKLSEGLMDENAFVPKTVRTERLMPIVQKISEEYLRTGALNQALTDELFDWTFAESVVRDASMYDQYKEVLSRLRGAAVTLSQQDQSDIPDFNRWKKSAFGTLKIVNRGGLPVDTFYDELHGMAPELFPESITHPADQLQRMYQVGQSIRVTERSLQECFGAETDRYKKWARHDFDNAVDRVLPELRRVRRYGEEAAARAAKEAIETPATVQEALDAYGQLKNARRDYERVTRKWLLTQEDELTVSRLLRGELSPENLDPDAEGAAGVLAVYEAKRAYEDQVKVITKYKRKVSADRRAKADTVLQTVREWKDKGIGLAYSRETMRRNILDIVPDRALAKRIVAEYFDPVQTAEAAATRFKTEFRDRVRKLGLSRKVDKKAGNIVSEAHAVQLLGEAMDNIEYLRKRRKYKGQEPARGGKTLEEWQAVVDDLWANNPGLDAGKIENAVREFRGIYDDLFHQMNDARVRNGYEPINYLQGYFPHFQPGEGDGILAAFGRGLGIDTQVAALPTTINGLTHTFRPGIQWFGNAQERLGFNTAYDAVEGFDKYIEGVSSVIHHTDNIQNLRALASQIRYNASDEGIKQQVDAVRNDDRLTEEEKKAVINGIYEKGKFALSNFVTELDEYTNLLANKKSRLDRTVEALVGRKFYAFAKWWENRVGANMIAGNIGSAVTNFIPITQATARVGKQNMLIGMMQTLRNLKNGDGFVAQSDFITNRRGSDTLVSTGLEKVSKAAGFLMERIDNFVSESVTRAAYRHYQQQGFSEAESMHQADIFAAGVLGDRSKGAMPTLFSSTNPVFKAFTQFQLEVNNQFSEVFKDLPREVQEKFSDSKGKQKAALLGVLLEYCIGAFIFNDLFEEVFGRRPALDPIGMLNDTVGDLTGYELPNIIGMWDGGVTKEDFQTEKVGAGKAMSNLATNTLGNLPFSSGLTLLGVELDGGRIPASSAVPNLSAVWQAATTEGWSSEKRWKEIQDELNKLAYIVPPFGGNQAQKIWKGLDAYFKGGSYSVDKDGNDILQYPVLKDGDLGDFWTAAQAALFGKSSLDEAQDWVESGFNSLGARQTAVYQDLLNADVDDRDAWELIRALSDAKGDGQESREAAQRRVLDELDISEDAKAIAYYGLLASESERELMDGLADSGCDAVYRMMMDLKSLGELKGYDRKNAEAELMGVEGLTDEGRRLLAAKILGDEMLTTSGKPSQYAKYLMATEGGLDGQRFMEMRRDEVDIDTYLDLTDVGVKSDVAADLATELAKLEPEYGEDTVSRLQRCQVIVSSELSAAQQMAVLEGIETESGYEKLCTGWELGVAPDIYYGLKTLLPEHDADGNGTYTQAEVKEAIDAMADEIPDDVLMALVGERGSENLTEEVKAILWQLQNKSWSWKKNPYDTEMGYEVWQIMNPDK